MFVISPICVSPYLVPWADRNLLSCPVSPGAHIDHVDPELLQLSGQQDALLYTPLQPRPV